MDVPIVNFQSILYGVIAILFAGLLSFTLTPPVRVLAFRIGAVDVPKDSRRMHKVPIPRLGGVAIFLSFVITTVIFSDIDPKTAGLLIGAVLIVLLGAFDDKYRLPALLKLVFQVLIACIPVYCGIVIERVNVFGDYIQFGVWSVPVTVFWIVAITNAINLIDGLDGLACGISTISAFSLLIFSLLETDTSVSILIAALAGACLGFLPYNHNPAKIFMGDSGALFLGYTLAVLSVQGLFKFNAVVSFLSPFLIFGIPLFDTVSSVIRRMIKRQPPFKPDRGHIHHKLMDIGFNQKQSVTILYSLSALLGIAAIMFTGERIVGAILIIVIAVIITLLNYRIFVSDKTTRGQTGIELNDPVERKDTDE